MNFAERVTRFETMLAEGRLLRGKWHDTRGGSEYACYAASLFPEANGGDFGLCPSGIMWPWLIHLLPWLDDAGRKDAASWAAKTLRVGAMLRGLASLTELQRAALGQPLDYQVRALCVREAMQHTKDREVLAACETVVALCDRAGSGDMPSKDQWAATAYAAYAAEEAAARAAAGAAGAAYAATADDGDALAMASKKAAWAAAWAAWAAEAASAEAEERLIDAILTCIEETCLPPPQQPVAEPARKAVCGTCGGSGETEEDATGALGYVVKKPCPDCAGGR